MKQTERKRGSCHCLKSLVTKRNETDEINDQSCTMPYLPNRLSFHAHWLQQQPNNEINRRRLKDTSALVLSGLICPAELDKMLATMSVTREEASGSKACTLLPDETLLEISCTALALYLLNALENSGGFPHDPPAEFCTYDNLLIVLCRSFN